MKKKDKKIHNLYWRLYERPKRQISSILNKILRRPTWKQINYHAKKHKFEIVIDNFEIVKLLGWTEDEDDYYWVYFSRNKQIIYISSAVGQHTRLKCRLSGFEYYTKLNHWHLNNPDDKELVEMFHEKYKNYELKG